MARECPVCADPRPAVFMVRRSVPVHCNRLWHTREEALAAPRGDVELAYCAACGHVFNAAFDPGRVTYDPEYENSLHCSPRFQEYARDLARRLVERHELRGTRIVEIGCGQGDFLAMMCEEGGSSGLGFDPGSSEERRPSTSADIRIFRGSFAPERLGDDPHVGCVVCRHVLEHVADPRSLLTSLREAARGPRAIVYVEVPNVAYTLRDLGIWDVIYEHVSYFSERSLHNLLVDSGFSVVAMSPSFGGQYIGVEARPLQPGEPPQRRAEDDGLAEAVRTFGLRHTEKMTAWAQEFSRVEAEGSRVVTWGTGSKGVTFLNAFPGRGPIEHAVDISPHKHGRYVPGTGQRVVHPKFLAEYRPGLVIVMNPVYADEIGEMLRAQGLDPAILPA